MIYILRYNVGSLKLHFFQFHILKSLSTFIYKFIIWDKLSVYAGVILLLLVMFLYNFCLISHPISFLFFVLFHYFLICTKTGMSRENKRAAVKDHSI